MDYQVNFYIFKTELQINYVLNKQKVEQKEGEMVELTNTTSFELKLNKAKKMSSVKTKKYNDFNLILILNKFVFYVFLLFIILLNLLSLIILPYFIRTPLSIPNE